MTMKHSLFLLVPGLLFVSCQNDMHRLKYINVGTNPPPNALPQFTSSMTREQLSNVKNRFSKADIVCVAGMWALYNTTDFGEGAEDFTTVISVRGTDINTCTKSGQIPVLKNVQSLVYLGNPTYSLDGVVIYSQAYFLGGMWTVPPTGELPSGMTGFPLGSLAITGTNAWVFCSDRDSPCSNGVCVNMKNYGNLFLQRNAAKDYSPVNGWPKIIRRVQMVSADDCLNYPNPAPLNPRRIFKRDTLDRIEISVYGA